MKRKMFIALSVIIVLGLCTFGVWLNLNSKDNPNILNFVNELERKGCKIEDITKAYEKTYPKKIKIPDNKKVFTVDGDLLFISIETDKTVNAKLEEYMSNLQGNYATIRGTPHLYRRDNLVVLYHGDKDKLLKILKDELGNPFIN